MTITIREIWNMPRISDHIISSTDLFSDRIKRVKFHQRYCQLNPIDEEYARYPRFENIMKNRNLDNALLQLDIEVIVSQILDDINLANEIYQYQQKSITIITSLDQGGFEVMHTVGDQVIKIGTQHEIFSFIPLHNGMFASCDYSRGLDITIWDITAPKGREKVRTLKGQGNIISTLIQLSNGMIASGGSGSSVCIWDITAPEGEELIKVLDTGLTHLIIQLFNGMVLVSNGEYVITIWDITAPEGQELVNTLRDHDKYITSIIQLSDTHIISSSYDGEIRAWDFTSPGGKEKTKILGYLSDQIIAVDRLPNGFIIIAGCNGNISILDMTAFPGHIQLRVIKSNHHSITVISNNIFITHNYDTIIVWDITAPEGQERIKILKGHTDIIKSVIKLSDTMIASSSNDGVRIWDITAPEGQEQIKQHWHCINNINQIIRLY